MKRRRRSFGPGGPGGPGGKGPPRELAKPRRDFGKPRRDTRRPERFPPMPRPDLPPPPPPPSREELDRVARSLPIHAHAEAILEAVRRNRVVVIEGPTGSGKTTQLPRILKRGGFGAKGIVGVTQPRRIAAVSVAWRIAQEEGVELGAEVGYAIRFDDQTGPRTRIKIMTDGILLQEARSDATFGAYEVLVVDEAHERSLNIDFTLGLLHRALERRPDLRVVVSSATLEPELFQRFFREVAGDVPLLSIAGRTFPVKLHHRPPPSDDPEAIAAACAEEVLRIHRSHEPGHVLVFLPGEGLIRETEEVILRGNPGRGLLTLPLYGRLTREEQERVFYDWPGVRKVVLATNIAETSITIPDVRFVVDSGLAKVPRVNPRTGISTLREEGISQASADQRAGRAGRTAPGEAIRLYAAQDLAARPRFTDEEVLRMELSEVMLRLIDLGIRDVESFPFPTKPPADLVQGALRKLRFLRAIDEDRHLTKIGARMVPFPLSPPLSRMIVEAADRHPDVVDEVLVAGAFLSGRPPQLFPAGEEVEARNAQRSLAHPMGDAVTAIRTYRAWQSARDPGAFCERHYLDPNVMAFVEKTHVQLADIAKRQGIRVSSGGSESGVVRSVAAGFADQVLVGTGRVYEGPGDLRIGIHPSSVLYGAHHRFVVAAELQVAERAYARQVSALKPEWAAEVNADVAHDPRVRRHLREHLPKVDPATIPDHVEVGGVRIPIEIVRGEPRWEVRVADVPRLAGAEHGDLPKDALSWKGRLASDHYHFCQGMPLGAFLRLAPDLPLPAQGELLERDVPEGLLLEADRNLFAIGRYLGRLLTPALPERGRQPGWVSLAANGGGGYWYEVVQPFPDAVLATLESLRDLAATVPAEDELQGTIEPLVDRVSDLWERVAPSAAGARKAGPA